jgi:hypothetical protein
VQTVLDASIATPVDASGTPGEKTPHLHSTPPTDIMAKLAKALPPEPDGATLHCIAVSIICFKVNRITVPPALVLATSGFVAGDAPKPPQAPYWATVQELTHCDARKPYLEFLKGGWRNVPAEDRWWDKALEGVEVDRKERLEVFRHLRSGLEYARESTTQGLS